MNTKKNCNLKQITVDFFNSLRQVKGVTFLLKVCKRFFLNLKRVVNV